MQIVIKEAIEFKVARLYAAHVSSALYSCGVDRNSSYDAIAVFAQVAYMDAEKVERFLNIIDTFMKPASISLNRVSAGYYELDIQVA